MSFILKKSSTGLLLLSISILGCLLLALNLLFPFIPESGALSVSTVFTGIFYSVFFIALAFILQKIVSPSSKKPKRIILNVFVVGIVTGFIAAIPELSKIFFGENIPSKAARISQTLAFFSSVSFFIYALLSFRQLTLIEQNGKIKYFWIALASILFVGNIYNLQDIQFPDVINYIYLGVAAAASLLLLIRINWIITLGRKQKYSSMLFLFLITGLIFLNGYLLWQQTFPLSIANHMMLICLAGFLAAYGISSTLGILFNLPVSAVYETRQKEMSNLREITRQINVNTKSEYILKLLYNILRECSKADAGWVQLNNNNGGENIIEETSISPKDLKRLLLSINYNQDHFAVKHEHHFVYIGNMQDHVILKNHDLPYRSALIFGLGLNNKENARFVLLSKSADEFAPETIDLIIAYLTQARLAINNSILIKETLETERFKKDMEIGKNLQKKLLPETFPIHKVVEIEGTSLAAEEVGGDYYDYFELSEDKYAFIIADVSGKGTPAAFHVAEMKGIFQSLIQSKLSPQEFVKRANKAVSACFERGMFITLIYMVIDLKEMKIKYSRAGHCPILHYRNDRKLIYYLEDEGMGLGIIRNNSYNKMVSEHEFSFQSGDVIMLYTDGVVEARNAKTSEEYGFGRLKEKIKKNSDEKAGDILNKVIKDVNQFAEFDLSRDDLSMLIFKVK